MVKLTGSLICVVVPKSDIGGGRLCEAKLTFGMEWPIFVAQTPLTVAALKDITKRQEHLIAELNHALHGKQSEKLTEDERQLAFEDLSIALAEVEAEKEQRAAKADDGARPAPKRTIGNLPATLSRIEEVIEPESLICPCGCGVAIVARTDGATLATAQDRRKPQ